MSEELWKDVCTWVVYGQIWGIAWGIVSFTMLRAGILSNTTSILQHISRNVVATLIPISAIYPLLGTITYTSICVACVTSLLTELVLRKLLPEQAD